MLPANMLPFISQDPDRTRFLRNIIDQAFIFHPDKVTVESCIGTDPGFLAQFPFRRGKPMLIYESINAEWIGQLGIAEP